MHAVKDDTQVFNSPPNECRNILGPVALGMEKYCRRFQLSLRNLILK